MSLQQRPADFSPRSLRLEFPFLATGDAGAKTLVYIRGRCPNRLFGFSALGIEPEPFELRGPFGGRIAQSGNADAAWQATFDSCFDQGWRQEGH